MRRLPGLTLALLVLLPGCGTADGGAVKPSSPTSPARGLDSPSQTPTTLSPKNYAFRVEGEIERDVLAVRGETDLPDGTLVSIHTRRANLEVGDSPDSPRAALSGGGAAIVEGGRFAASVPLSTDHLMLLVGPAGHVIAAISRSVTVCTEVQTGADADGTPRQPSAKVRTTLGEDGDALAGHPDAIVFGSKTESPSRWLQNVMEIPYPPPVDEIQDKQGTRPEVRALQGFC